MWFFHSYNWVNNTSTEKIEAVTRNMRWCNNELLERVLCGDGAVDSPRKMIVGGIRFRMGSTLLGAPGLL
jgi:hypothetical protein